MRDYQFTRFCAWSVGLLLLCSWPGVGLVAASNLKEQQTCPQSAMLSELARAQIVYLGERHDSAAAHRTQLEIIEALYQRQPQMAIALEMFQHPYQAVLDKYLAGEISEAELREQTEYDQRWGYPWEYYAPILRLAQTHQLPLLALNTPTEIARQVARQGLDSLTERERQLIPPLEEIRTDNADYRRLSAEVYQQHVSGGHGNSQGMERFFTVQVLWDETMAAKIAQFYRANPGYQIVVLAGSGHIIYGYGIPSRVQRRLKDLALVQRSVLVGDFPLLADETGKPAADFSCTSD